MTVRRVDFYPADFFGGVAGMSAELIGVYWIICTLLYMSDGSIKTDDPRLKKNSGVSYQRLPGALRDLRDLGKIDLGNDQAVTQQRVSSELARAQLRIDKAQASGKQGGRKTKDNNDLGKPDGLTQEKLSDIIQQPSTIISSVSNETADVSRFPNPRTPEQRYFDEVVRVLGNKGRSLGAKLLKACDGDAGRASLALNTAATKSGPREWIGAVLRGERKEMAEEVLAETRAMYKRMGVI